MYSPRYQGEKLSIPRTPPVGICYQWFQRRDTRSHPLALAIKSPTENIQRRDDNSLYTMWARSKKKKKYDD